MTSSSLRLPARRVVLALTAGVALVLLLPALATAAPPADCAPAASSFDAYRARGWLWAFGAAFGFGFLTSLTPCVYPMIPIVLGVFGARGEQVSRGKAMLLATLYVVGMGVTYSTLGVVFALVGGQFGALLANPWVVGPIVLLYVALAASMFGAFELNLPASLQARLSQVGGSGLGGAFAMGLVGGFTAAPCTGPFLVGLLGFVASSGNAPVGAALLFTYALGMGVLFWVLAAFAVSLPRSGRWMEWVKSVGGIALLVAALYFLRPVVPALQGLASAETWFLVAAAAAVVVGVALGAVHLSFHDVAARKLRKALGVGLAVAGLTGVIGWLLTPDRHLPWIQRDAAAVEALVAQHGLALPAQRPGGDPWLHPAEAAAFALAATTDKGVMIDFSADWCTPCAELELTFADDAVFGPLTEGFVPLKIDVTEGTDADDELQARYDAETLPAVVFLDATGRELGRVSKYLPPDEFLPQVRAAVAARRAGPGATPCVARR